MHALDDFRPDGPFKRRVRCHTVAGNGLPASTPVRHLLIFLPVRRVASHDGSGSGGGRLKPVDPFLSLLHVKVQESPPSFVYFHFGPLTFNCVYSPDFSYISFDFLRLGPAIASN